MFIVETSPASTIISSGYGPRLLDGIINQVEVQQRSAQVFCCSWDFGLRRHSRWRPWKNFEATTQCFLEMASRSSISPFQLLDKLTGRENYRSWAVAIRAYLESEDLWDTVEAPAGEDISTDVKKLARARGRMVLAVAPGLFPYLENAQTPKQVWDELSKTYDDKGLARKVNLLQEATTTKFENCRSMEDYVTRIISATKKLTAIGMALPEDLVGALLLAGLPAEYKPMIMALSNSGTEISGDLIKNKLLEESQNVVNNFESESGGLHAQAQTAQFGYTTRRGRAGSQKTRGASRRSTGARCYNCNKFGHYANKCTAKKSEQTNACTMSKEEDSEEEETVCALFVSSPTRLTHTVR